MPLPESAETDARTASEPARDIPCFHCGLPVPPGTRLEVTIDGTPQPMCCHGCQAVARAIVDAGHTDFYRHRTQHSPTGTELVPDFIRETEIYDHPAVQQSFVRTAGPHEREADLILEGIVCAACVWLNERHIRSLPGVLDVQINYATHRAQVRWDEQRIQLSGILQAIQRIGYRAHPYDPEHQQQLYDNARRDQLKRIGLAGVLGMQVMMLSLALYSGDWTGADSEFRTLFHWVALLLTTPVLLYSGAGFFQGAWRDLRNRSVGMDVPVSLGIAVAFSGSVHATVTGSGEVYFDSVVMFVFFLLTSRYFELVARRRSAEKTERLTQSLPALAHRVLENGDTEEVAVAELQGGDRLLVRPGETIPADGIITDGISTVSEALLTGESTPLERGNGDEVTGGSINIESALTVSVTRTGADTVLAGILRLMERARNEKPALTQLADRVAGWFVSAVLVIAVAVGLYWWQHAPESWLPVLVSVLVVTCPCALSLATPTAISAASGALLGKGLLATGSNTLETMARCSHIVFDKTGTLTRGEPSVAGVTCYSDLDRQAVLQLAAALERHSEHPAGKAIVAAAADGGPQAHDVINHPGAGISATIDGRSWFIGNATFIAAHTGTDGMPGPESDAATTRVLLADQDRIHAVIELEDTLRSDAAETVASLQARGYKVILMSGDSAAPARHVAGMVGITDVMAGMEPAAKLREVQALQSRGAVVLMAGDGINDAPVLAAADISLAMRDAAHISQSSADMLLVSNRLTSLPGGLALAGRCMRIVRQNLVWAAGYNIVALPAAALGYVAPWMAAIGMSASSVLVVLNALRLARD